MGRREQIDWIGSMKMEPGEPNSDTGNESIDADDALINRISFRGQNPNQMEMLWSQLGPFLQILWDSWRLLQSFLTHGNFQGILKFFFFFVILNFYWCGSIQTLGHFHCGWILHWSWRECRNNCGSSFRIPFQIQLVSSKDSRISKKINMYNLTQRMIKVAESAAC